MAIRRKAGSSGTRKAVAPSLPEASLDDRPLEIRSSMDGKWLFVSLPHEVWVMSAGELAFQRSIELDVPEPHVAEGEDGLLWIAGKHLYRANAFLPAVTKFGSKLGGFAHKVVLLQPHFLACIGPSGELLFDLEGERILHQRKHTHRAELGLVASADERAVFVDGESSAWVIDPAHPDGYMRLALRDTSGSEVESEGLVMVGRTSRGRIIVAARDGAVAFTTPDLRVAKESVPHGGGPPLALAGDERWIYVLRGRGLLHRFLVEQPRSAKKAKKPPPTPTKKSDEDEPEPLPEAQSVRLEKPASCLALLRREGRSELVLGGPRADGQLGRLWRIDPETLAWQSLALGKRTLVEANVATDVRAPNFVAIRTRVDGPPLAALAVDEVIAGKTTWLVASQGTSTERATMPMPSEAKPADTLLLPAMVRHAEGTARPALVLWPGCSDAEREAPEIGFFVWGDSPRGWMALDTPAIREQKWRRAAVFPLQVALPGPSPEVPGHRLEIPRRWIDPTLFAALVSECKHLLKVLW